MSVRLLLCPMRQIAVLIALLFTISCKSAKPVPIGASARAGALIGEVVGVHDGDTITVLDADKVQHKIRLDGIDSPELKQAFGSASKQNLSSLVFGKSVSVVGSKKDRYGRLLGVVFVDGANVNEAMVRDGFAWHFKTYSKDKVLAQLEIDARTAKHGLWSQSDAVAPWDFRKR